MTVVPRSLPGQALLPVTNSNTQVGGDAPDFIGADEGGVLPAAVAAA